MQTTNLIIYFLCYAMFFILSWINKINNNQRLINDEGAFTSKPGNLIGSHIIGILWLGIVPLFFLNHSILNFLFGNAIPDAYAVFSFLLILLPAVIIIFRQSKNVTSGKTMSYENFIRLSPAFIIRYFIIRAVFIFVYELWFRGFLLFDCISWVGMPAAVMVNVFLYVLLHIFNSRKEMLICIPFGILVCILSILFNAVWPAILLHIGVSMVYELTIYRSYLITSKIKLV